MAPIFVWMDRCATWPRVAFLFFLFAICVELFELRKSHLGEAKIPDVRMGYTPKDLADLYSEWGESKRQTYALTQLTLDMAFPAIYGTLFGAILSKLYRPRWPKAFPCAMGCADVGENLLVASLALAFDGNENPLAWLASGFTLLKFGFSLGTFLVLGWGGFRRWHHPD